jgi:hypothetical protein
MSPRRTVRAALGVFAALPLLLGCGDAGGLRAAGSTPTAVSPTRLWPGESPATSPVWDYGEAETETVKGVAVPGDDIHRVDPVALVRAEMTAYPDMYEGSGAPYRDTARRMADCGPGGDRGRCPVLKAYYRDLTGDGHDDMTLGFRLLPTNQTAVRVYTVERHRLVEVLRNDDAVIGVELAGRALIIRSPSQIAGYEYRTQWTWDADQGAMLMTRDEFLRTGGAGRGAHRSPHPPSPESPSSTPSSPTSVPSSTADGR